MWLSSYASIRSLIEIVVDSHWIIQMEISGEGLLALFDYYWIIWLLALFETILEWIQIL